MQLTQKQKIAVNLGAKVITKVRGGKRYVEIMYKGNSVLRRLWRPSKGFTRNSVVQLVDEQLTRQRRAEPSFESVEAISYAHTITFERKTKSGESRAFLEARLVTRRPLELSLDAIKRKIESAIKNNLSHAAWSYYRTMTKRTGLFGYRGFEENYNEGITTDGPSISLVIDADGRPDEIISEKVYL